MTPFERSFINELVKVAETDQEAAKAKARRNKMLLGGLLGAGAVGAAHHFGLDSALAEKVKALFGNKVTGNEVFDQYGGEISPHEDEPSAIDSIKKLIGMGPDVKQTPTGPLDQITPKRPPSIFNQLARPGKSLIQ